MKWKESYDFAKDTMKFSMLFEFVNSHELESHVILPEKRPERKGKERKKNQGLSLCHETHGREWEKERERKRTEDGKNP